MKVIGFDNRKYNIQINEFIVYDNDSRERSEPHLKARKLIRSIFPCSIILEEVTLPGSARSGNSTLYGDFLLPSEKLLIEVHGAQHYSFNKFFHGSKSGFESSKKRDATKKEWCEINNIKYVELPDGENDDEWKQRILR